MIKIYNHSLSVIQTVLKTTKKKKIVEHHVTFFVWEARVNIYFTKWYYGYMFRYSEARKNFSPFLWMASQLLCWDFIFLVAHRTLWGCWVSLARYQFLKMIRTSFGGLRKGLNRSNRHYKGVNLELSTTRAGVVSDQKEGGFVKRESVGGEEAESIRELFFPTWDWRKM